MTKGNFMHTVLSSEETRSALECVVINDCVDVDLLAEELSMSIYETEDAIDSLIQKGMLSVNFLGEIKITSKGFRKAHR
jgi:hypothetical protein